MKVVTPKLPLPIFAANSVWSKFGFLLLIFNLLAIFGMAKTKSDSIYLQQINQLWTRDYPKYVIAKDFEKVLTTVNTIDSLASVAKDFRNRADAHWVKSMYAIALGHWKKLPTTLKTWENVIHQLPQDEYKEILIASLHYHYGSYHLYRWNQEAAIFFFEKVIEAHRNGVEMATITLKDTYVNQGLAHRRLGDFKRAITYYEQAISFIGEKQVQEKAKVLQNIARAWLQSETPNKAKNYFYQAKSLIDAIPANKVNPIIRSGINRNIGEFHTLVTENLDSAHYYIDVSFLPEKDTLGLINSWQRKGLAHLKGEQFEKANTAFKQALNLGEFYFSNNHPELAETLLGIGNGFQQQKNSKEAIVYYQKALTALNKDFQPKENLANPRLNQIPIKELGIAVLQEKAQALNDIGFQKDALDTYQLIDSLIDQKRLKDIITDESAYAFIGRTKNIYEQAIATALAQNEELLAFTFAQKAHGLRLLQYMQHDLAKTFGHIPDSLIAQERQFKIQINDKERRLYQANLNVEEKERIRTQLFETEETYALFIKQLEKDYPTYFQIKYELPATSLKELQQKVIRENTLLIEYFLGENILYAFSINQVGLKVFELPLADDFKAQILTFKTLLSKNSDDQTKFTEYCKVGSQLYQTTLQRILNNQPTKAEHLIIIPDDILNYISFAALLTEPVNPNGRVVNYFHLPYLVKDYTISYNYSSALFYQKERSIKNLFLNAQAGFAPIFSGQYSGARNLDSLLHNDKEVMLIDSIVNGKIFLDTAATVQNFKKEINHCKIAHLATHATCNDSLPLNSNIYFYDGLLPIHELYALQNTLELVVLSACETGTGLLKKGEGILSFARAFLQAGCPSIITSLWKVNDRQTPALMEQLYLNLKDGLPKNEALSLAQRQYLNQAETLADTHPYYWANFILIGNTDKIELGNRYLLLVLILPIVLLGLIFWYRTRGKKSG